MIEQSNKLILRRYLLADLNDAEREAIEERLFSDESLTEELARAETDLIDDYALGALNPYDRELFKQNFILSDERRKNLLFAQAIDVYLEEENSHRVEPQPLSWQKESLRFLKMHKGWATAAVAAVVLLLFLPPVIRWVGFDNDVTSINAQREDRQRRITELSRQPLSREQGIEVSLRPTTLLRGSGDLAQVQIAKEVKLLNLNFLLTSAQYNKYTVTARTVEGDELFTITDLSPNANGEASVFLRIPAEFLTTNDFQFEVKGIAADGRSTTVGLYNLRVLHWAS